MKKELEKNIIVEKNNYEVYPFISGYFGICKTGELGRGCVFGGDSGSQDSYNETLINSVYENWNGELVYTGKKYGYRIEL